MKRTIKNKNGNNIVLDLVISRGVYKLVIHNKELSCATVFEVDSVKEGIKMVNDITKLTENNNEEEITAYQNSINSN